MYYRGIAGEQLGGSLRGLVLLQAGLPQPWERVVALGLSSRPSDPISHTLYFEAMGRCDPQCMPALPCCCFMCPMEHALAPPLHAMVSSLPLQAFSSSSEMKHISDSQLAERRCVGSDEG